MPELAIHLKFFKFIELKFQFFKFQLIEFQFQFFELTKPVRAAICVLLLYFLLFAFVTIIFILLLLLFLFLLLLNLYLCFIVNSCLLVIFIDGGIALLPLFVIQLAIIVVRGVVVDIVVLVHTVSLMLPAA